MAPDAIDVVMLEHADVVATPAVSDAIFDLVSLDLQALRVLTRHPHGDLTIEVGSKVEDESLVYFQKLDIRPSWPTPAVYGPQAVRVVESQNSTKAMGFDHAPFAR